MSGLPIMPAMPAAPAFQREAMPQAQPTPGLGVAATVRTVTAAAVQQAPTAHKPLSLPQQVLPTPPDRRTRLVGPPPTFDVNVLQDLHETRKAPPEPELQDPEQQEDANALHDAGSDPIPQDARNRPGHSSYATLLALAELEDMADTTMDRSV